MTRPKDQTDTTLPADTGGAATLAAGDAKPATPTARTYTARVECLDADGEVVKSGERLSEKQATKIGATILGEMVERGILRVE